MADVTYERQQCVEAFRRARSRIETVRADVAALFEGRRQLARALRAEAERVAAGRCPTITRSSIDLRICKDATTSTGSNLEERDGLLRSLEIAADLAAYSDDESTVDVLSHVRDMADRVAEPSADATISSDHIEAFLALANPSGSLSDDEWTSAIEKVRLSFGSRVSTAIMRGRFFNAAGIDASGIAAADGNESEIVRETQTAVDQVGDAIDVERCATPVAAESEEVASIGDPVAFVDETKPEEDARPGEGPGSYSVFDDDSTDDDGPPKRSRRFIGLGVEDADLSTTPTAVTSPTEVPNDSDVLVGQSDSGFAENVFSEEGEGLLSEERWYGSLAAEFAAIRASKTPESTDQVSAWTFLSRDEPALAYQLAKSESSAVTPIMMLWLVSREIRHAHGHLARIAEEQIQQLVVKNYDDVETLLLRAALMKIVVVAPQTNAGQVLRSLPRSTQQTRVTNLSLRAANVGERLGGVLNHEFKSCRESELASELVDVLSAIRDRVSYTIAAPLYLSTHWSLRTPVNRDQSAGIERWRNKRSIQHCASRVLGPLVEGGPGQYRSVRLESDRVRQMLEHGDLTHEDRALLAEADYLVRCYGQLQSRGEVAEGYVPVEISELSQEMRVRRTELSEELRTVTTSHKSERADTAARAYTQSLVDLAELLDPTNPISSSEPGLLQLLGGELLKVAGIELNADWTPSTDASQLASLIREYGTRGAISWEAAYIARANSGDEVGCRHVLAASSLAPSVRERLVRDHKPASSTQNVIENIDETAELVSEAVRLHMLDEADGAEFQAIYRKLQDDELSSEAVARFAERADELRRRIERERAAWVKNINARSNDLKQAAQQTDPGSRQNDTSGSTQRSVFGRANEDRPTSGPSVFDD